jgi:hypothetical protein
MTFSKVSLNQSPHQMRNRVISRHSSQITTCKPMFIQTPLNPKNRKAQFLTGRDDGQFDVWNDVLAFL